MVANGLAASPIHQVLLERWVGGWKEIEYEVMRDGANNCITVCNMENIDPMGVHTGDSIVVAPSQTLTNKEYQMLRTASLKIIRALGIEGGCNIQFALDPYSSQYYVIEVNPRVSRSSALASKATGYPIARVAAKIAVGKRLDEIPNAVTGKTMASFEPALDYMVVKIPRWPFDKFASGDRIIGTQMKATGEVMAIDRTFEAALQKAVRSLEFGKRTLLWEDPKWEQGTSINDYPLEPNDLRLWAIMAALRRGITPEAIADHTKIDLWFLDKLQNIVNMEKTLLSQTLTPELLRQAKRLGFSDGQIGTLADRLPEQVRADAPRMEYPPRLQDGGYLRRRVRCRHPLLLQHLRAGKRGGAAGSQQGGGHRQRAHPHRAGHRVRLLQRALRLGAPGSRLQEHHGQLQPGDGLHRL